MLDFMCLQASISEVVQVCDPLITGARNSDICPWYKAYPTGNISCRQSCVCNNQRYQCRHVHFVTTLKI